jgi:hypothetical protein
MKALTNREIVSLHSKLYQLSDLPGFMGFAQIILENRNRLDAYREKLHKELTPSKDFVKFETEENKLKETHTVEGKLVENNEFKKARKALKEKYKIAIKARDRRKRDFDKKFELPATIELLPLNIVNIPDSITANQLDAISSIIEE